MFPGSSDEFLSPSPTSLKYIAHINHIKPDCILELSRSTYPNILTVFIFSLLEQLTRI